MIVYCVLVFLFFFQAEDGIRDLVRSRGLGDVYKRQFYGCPHFHAEKKRVNNFRNMVLRRNVLGFGIDNLSLIHI